MPPVSDPAAPVLLFDGLCTLCDRSVQFVLDHDRDGVLRFASLQSPVGQGLLRRCGLTDAGLDSLVLVEGRACHVRSEAALRVAAHLDAPWRWMTAARVVPRVLRDQVYDWVAGNRLRWFGARTECRVPGPDVRDRFLDTSL